MKRSSTGRSGLLQVASGQRGWDSTSQFFLLDLPLGRQGSVRAYKELDEGSHGSKRLNVRSASPKTVSFHLVLQKCAVKMPPKKGNVFTSTSSLIIMIVWFLDSPQMTFIDSLPLSTSINYLSTRVYCYWLVQNRIDIRFKSLCYSHILPDFEPDPYGVKTVSTRFKTT
jgi:hypothetical protein